MVHVAILQLCFKQIEQPRSSGHLHQPVRPLILLGQSLDPLESQCCLCELPARVLFEKQVVSKVALEGLNLLPDESDLNPAVVLRHALLLELAQNHDLEDLEGQAALLQRKLALQCLDLVEQLLA